MGGLVGNNSYYNNTITYSYYNTDTCGASANNELGIGKTTTELLTQATFSGWDFSDGGTWRIAEGTNYPVLQWQLAAAPVITSPDSYTVGLGIGGTFLVKADGIPPVSFYSITGAPAGVSIDSLSGKMTIAGSLVKGTYTFTITAANGIEPDATQAFTLKVVDLPVRKAEAPSSTTATVLSGLPYTSDLNAIFEDPRGGTLTYLVSINGAAYIEVNADYTYTPGRSGITTLVFKAKSSDGVESVDTYTVKLTVLNPISNVNDLDRVCSNLSGYYILMNDIDLGGANWEPYETFKGIFYGNGYTISNFKIDSKFYEYMQIGFFRSIEAGATVENLTLENYVVTGPQRYMGGLVGYNEGTIIGCSGTGSVTGEYSNEVGGLVGCNKGGTITECYATGDVYGNYVRVGGLVGLNENGIITESYATGNVSGNDNSLGGLAGANSGSGTISDCYATGSVTCMNETKTSVGGLVGDNSGTASITNCYAIGAVSGGASSMGGLVGSNSGSISSSYYNTDTCGAGANNGLGTGKTTAELKNQSTFVNWDFSDGGTWWIAENIAHPLLKWQPVAAPEITSPDKYAVSVGIGGKFQVKTNGTPPVGFYSITGAPAGVSIDSLTGKMIIDGNLSKGTHTFTITAVNGIKPDATQEFTLKVVDPPVLKTGVPSSTTVAGWEDTAYTLALNNIFEDPYAGTLTYLESVNDPDYIEAAAAYTYTPDEPAISTFVFKSKNSDGVASTDTYKVTLTAGGVISTAENLSKVRNNLSLPYQLINDINLNSANWEPIGTFTGKFNGNGHKIYNFTINTDTNYAGFFSTIAQGAEV